MSKYFISIFLGLLPILGKAQSEPIDLQQKDTVEYKDPYGLRVGVDLSKLVLTFVDEDYTGLELVGDFRLTRKLYLAAEIGNETKAQSENLGNTLLYNFETSGSYIKAGVDINTYTNWFGMNNAITIGGRYAVSSFSQTLGDYSIYETEQFFNSDFLAGTEPNREFSGLTASWLEFVVGVKAELFANIFIGMSARLGFLVTNTEDEQFPNLWIPGFNKVTDGSNFGVNYNYSISYFLPLYKKSRNKKTAETSEQ
ncbi:DUF6048 family protein [Flagellimonas zhangzhouensis]|uniref:Outer membrane protein beta-barrel domain-containing protein n=1 Tax=Flagellimonas zhangzhouensis TaxID=1073328 RepID=A0A1H2Y2M1_9FLAO|nr:DUF6048 family protein [Allomuricauda zhangzhouensis]SDQ94334.1 hypothetical protein SAMN05216294_2941 [Allomuricauda zhangzhouensis]SDW98954.1 hypothetical protein SAMN04487892_2933 [Allomuricauda zhangzhouensis]